VNASVLRTAIDSGRQHTTVRCPVSGDPLWPRYADPADLATIEAVPLEARSLPESTYAPLVRAADQWPEKTALRSSCPSSR
jgi:fatty-acyl-CoA synthase